MPTVLFCADPLHPRRVDPFFRAEAEAVREQAGTIALVDHDALRRGDAAAAVRRVARDLGPMWYRGWMVTGTEYAALAGALRARGGELVVRPDDYSRAHELPGWHDTFAGLTPRSVWLPLPPGTPPAPAVLAELVRSLTPGAAVVKDYVKSRKHEWAEACFVPDLTDTEALHAVVARMVALQNGDLYGGLVVREYEPYAGDGEARVWWIDGEPVLYGPHPDTPDLEPEPAPEPTMDAIGSAVRALGCRFITTDLARLSGHGHGHGHGRDGGGDGDGDGDGGGVGGGDAGRAAGDRSEGGRAPGDPAGSGWRVVEVGDGQVSGLPASIDPADLFALLPDPMPSFPLRNRPEDDESQETGNLR